MGLFRRGLGRVGSPSDLLDNVPYPHFPGANAAKEGGEDVRAVPAPGDGDDSGYIT